jgi:tetratricopeptide (TPR) repeat protein
MMRKGVPRTAPIIRLLLAIALVGAVAACVDTTGYSGANGPYAPGVDLSKPAEDGVEVGNRLMAAGENELALEAFTRAALDQGMTADVLIGIGTANLGLGRLGQAETQLRRATRDFPESPEAWNNLGVVLMETEKIPEAQQVFRKAYALDNGESDSIRDNLRLALAKSENPVNNAEQNQEYKLVRRGSGEYLIRRTSRQTP